MPGNYPVFPFTRMSNVFPIFRRLQGKGTEATECQGLYDIFFESFLTAKVGFSHDSALLMQSTGAKLASGTTTLTMLDVQ